jgi:hypothetical protein
VLANAPEYVASMAAAERQQRIGIGRRSEEALRGKEVRLGICLGIVVYGVGIHNDRHVRRDRPVVPFFAVAAAMFDATENVFLLLVLEGHGGEHAPLIATICSSIKFTLITIAIVYVVWGLAWRAVTARRVKLTSTPHHNQR